MIELNTIYHEDCLETLKRMPDNFVDVVITSPPYNMNLRIRNGEYCSRQIVKEFSSKYNGFDDNLPIEQFYELHKQIVGELLRVSKLVFYNIQIVTGSKRAFFRIIGDYANYLKDIIIWDKGHAQPAMQHKVLNKQSELILVLEKDKAISRMFEKCNFARGTLSDVWEIKRGKKVSKEHGATFPEELVEKIILNFSNENDVIYDPFMGTGTTAVVAARLNRKFVGSELTEHYFEFSKKRLEKKFMGQP